MKKLVLGLIMVMSCFASASQASDKSMAEMQVSGEASFTEELVKLFAKEAATPNSEINKFMTALKNDPENEGYFIYDTITEVDIVRLESGGSGGSFEINYLILIRAGYKRSTFQVGYLKADAIISSEDESQPALIRITEPAHVIVE